MVNSILCDCHSLLAFSYSAWYSSAEVGLSASPENTATSKSLHQRASSGARSLVCGPSATCSPTILRMGVDVRSVVVVASVMSLYSFQNTRKWLSVALQFAGALGVALARVEDRQPQRQTHHGADNQRPDVAPQQPDVLPVLDCPAQPV